MNKPIIFALIIFAALAAAACYQKSSSSSNAVKPVQSSASSSPVAENSLESAQCSASSSPIAAEPAALNNQTNVSGDYDRALDYLIAKNYEKAAAEFEAVVTTDAKNRQAYLHLGKSYQALSKTDKAIGAYKQAIELKPDDPEANYELGKILLDKKDYETSLPFIEKAAKIKYTSPEYLLALGDNYRELKKCDYAMVPYGKVSGFDDKNTAAYYGMGLCYIELKNRIAAGQQVRNLEKLDKDLAKKLADKIPK